MDIQVIPKSKSLVPEILNVAAYARVSSDKDAMLHSLSAQTSYYSDLIQSTPNWNYVGVYADEAKSGTKDTRPEFQRMADDCRAGKIDMIITKSVSRFARNTVTLLSLCREFKAMGIDVYFERENIHTKSEQGELMLTLLASFAQAEAEATSENVKWRIKEQFKEGKPTGFTIYGYEVRKGKFTIVEDEAEVVREIFKMYLDGMGSYLIADELNRRCVKSPYGGVWHDGTIMKILQNEKYAGDLLLQKTFVNNPLTKKQILNKGQKEKYYVDEHHIPIIDRETFDKVQKLIGEKEKKYAKCTTAIVTEDVVKNAFVEVFNGLIENRDSLMGFVQSTIDKLLDTEAVDDKIAVAQRRADKRLEELGDYVKLNMRTAIPQSEYKAKYAELSEAREKAEAVLKEHEQEKIELINRRKRSEAFMRTLAENEALLPEFDEGLFGVTVERVTVGQDKLIFEFKDGYTTEYKL